MSTLFTEAPTELPSESAGTIQELHDLIRGHVSAMGVPTIDELMAQVDETVRQLHGPMPATPTWEEVLESWAATKLALETPAPPAEIEAPLAKDDIIDAEIVDEPAPLSTGRAAAKALPAKPRARKRPTPKAIAAK